MGVDRSPEMIAAARKAFPNFNFEVGDGRTLSFEAEFEAVFSNATLHWIHQPALVIAGVFQRACPRRKVCRGVWRKREYPQDTKRL